MLDFAAISAEIVATIAVFAITNLAILAYRNPLKTGWLRSSSLQLVVEMVCISAVLVVVPVLCAGVVGEFKNLIVGGVVFVVLLCVIYLGLSHLMHMGERLALCDQGQSPFKSAKPPVAGGTMQA